MQNRRQKGDDGDERGEPCVKAERAREPAVANFFCFGGDVPEPEIKTEPRTVSIAGAGKAMEATNEVSNM